MCVRMWVCHWHNGKGFDQLQSLVCFIGFDWRCSWVVGTRSWLNYTKSALISPNFFMIAPYVLWYDTLQIRITGTVLIFFCLVSFVSYLFSQKARNKFISLSGRWSICFLWRSISWKFPTFERLNEQYRRCHTILFLFFCYRRMTSAIVTFGIGATVFVSGILANTTYPT